ncbi:MAG TPA: hypothetical protein VL463_14100 [Kofleriaceae bacterium]|nr:hypothetical protein [Kofleriaceae bacterium]
MSTSTRTKLGLACLMLALSLGASACNLYFGPDHSQDHWTYCDQSGCYDCNGNSCTPQGGPGYYCESSNQCAAGCYCDLVQGDSTYGTCVEAGFCSDSSQCQSGYHCDARGSCVPDTNPTGCSSSADCSDGSYCDTLTGSCVRSTTCGNDGTCPTGYQCDSRGTCVPVACTDSTMCNPGCYCDTTQTDPNYGQCVETGYCTNDTQCPNGYYCDEGRSTCMPGTDPNAPSCAGTIDASCTVGMPACQDGQVATIQNGCWTGSCQTISTCTAAPSCAQLTHQDDCMNRAADCSVVTNGVNCTKPDGTACQAGDVNCTCEKYVFASCTAK